MIDWGPFFRSWGLHGRYPDLLDDALIGEEARKLKADAEAMLDRMAAENAVRCQAVFGLFEAHRDGDDVRLVSGDTLHFLRQQSPQGQICLADFIAPNGTEGIVTDHIGAFCVTAGHGLEEWCIPFREDDDDYSEILAKALADRLAEAAAEWLHREVRTHHWGYAADEALDNEALIAEQYRDPPSPRLPGLPGPPGQDHPLADARCGGQHRRHLDRELRPCGRPPVCRACTSPIQTPSTSDWAKSCPTNSRTTQPDVANRWRKPPNGCLPCCSTVRKPQHHDDHGDSQPTPTESVQH